MKVTFFGTAAGQPSLKRNTTSIALTPEKDSSKWFMIDCGEATIIQIMKSDLKLSNIHSIFITHLHGDHVYGLPGVIASMSDTRDTPLYIYGPVGIAKFFKMFEHTAHTAHNFRIIIKELEEDYTDIVNIKFNSFDVRVESCSVKHSIDCLAYKFTSERTTHKINMSILKPLIDENFEEIKALGYNPPQKIIKKITTDIDFEFTIGNEQYYSRNFINYEEPKKLVIAMDNYNCSNIFKYFVSCNTLIHESTYNIFDTHSESESKMIEKKALAHGHSTNLMAVKNAMGMSARKLILTHFSNRYEFDGYEMKDEDKIYRGCKKIGFSFGEILFAYDFKSFEI